MATLQHNYLPKQYQANNQLPINHNFLPQQFSDSEAIIDEIKQFHATDPILKQVNFENLKIPHASNLLNIADEM